MKVKVKVKHTPLNQVEYFLNEALSEALADLDAAHQEIEKLFQENKDLRVQVGHLRDELNLARQQSEARRQVICERDKLIQELNDQIAADEYRIAAMESDCQVNELEKQLEWVRNKNDEWAAVAQGLRNTIEELKAQKEADDKKIEEICTACNERYEDVLAERNRLREEVARLTTERDAAIKENTTLIFRNSDLEDELEAVINIKNDYAEQIDTLRKERNALSRKANDTTAGFWNFLVEHGLVKTEEELGGNHNETEH